MLSILNPGPGLVEEVDCEKPRALTTRKKPNTNRTIRMRNFSFRTMREILCPTIHDDQPQRSNPFATVIIKIHRFRKGWSEHDVSQWQRQQRLHRPSPPRRVASPPQERKHHRQLLPDALRAPGSD